MMARKPNYDQDKRRKELERKARQDAKRLERDQRRTDRQSEPSVEPEPGTDSRDNDEPPRAMLTLLK